VPLARSPLAYRPWVQADTWGPVAAVGRARDREEHVDGCCMAIPDLNRIFKWLGKRGAHKCTHVHASCSFSFFVPFQWRWTGGDGGVHQWRRRRVHDDSADKQPAYVRGATFVRSTRTRLPPLRLFFC
jgi:hypothetical protein